jgi:hypothetical protein
LREYTLQICFHQQNTSFTRKVKNRRLSPLILSVLDKTSDFVFWEKRGVMNEDLSKIKQYFSLRLNETFWKPRILKTNKTSRLNYLEGIQWISEYGRII